MQHGTKNIKIIEKVHYYLFLKNLSKQLITKPKAAKGTINDAYQQTADEFRFQIQQFQLGR